jgi:hypothetical protein
MPNVGANVRVHAGASIHARCKTVQSAISVQEPLTATSILDHFTVQLKHQWIKDLQDELTWYGAMSRRPSLYLFCRAYGIASPKIEVGGDDVAELFVGKKFRDIARYNAADVRATTELSLRV